MARGFDAPASGGFRSWRTLVRQREDGFPGVAGVTAPQIVRHFDLESSAEMAVDVDPQWATGTLTLRLRETKGLRDRTGSEP
jgi:hypothetical protein